MAYVEHAPRMPEHEHDLWICHLGRMLPLTEHLDGPPDGGDEEGKVGEVGYSVEHGARAPR